MPKRRGSKDGAAPKRSLRSRTADDDETRSVEEINAENARYVSAGKPLQDLYCMGCRRLTLIVDMKVDKEGYYWCRKCL